MDALHYSTAQISAIKIHLRDSLAVAIREFGGKPMFIIEDELNSRFYRIGKAEYDFISRLDGRTTFADALGRSASTMKEDALSESEAASLCHWLVEGGLATTAESRSAERLYESSQRLQQHANHARLNPIFLKIPLFNPDSLLKIATSILGWIFSAPAILIWMLIMAAAGGCVHRNWSDVATMTSNVFSAHNWIWLLCSWLMLRVIHETCHGMACTRFGGLVRETGVMLILFVPMPYVDVTSAWRLDSRRQRMLISAAGMYAELFIAAIATFVWIQLEPGILRQQAFNVMFSASIVTILFNANPLMRFDGYYLLSDFFEMPNLASHGQLCFKGFVRRLFLGLKPARGAWQPERTHWVFLYGLLAFIWRVLICVGLILTADSMLHGAGVILASVAVIMWVALPTVRLAVFLIKGSSTERPSVLRFATVSACLTAGLYLAAQIPWYHRVTTPVVVHYETPTHVRSAVSGFVSSVHVSTGSDVKKGATIIVLENPELESTHANLLAQLRRTEQSGRLYHFEQEIAAWSVEQETATSLRKRLQQIDEQLAQLTIVAPEDGILLDSDLDYRIGRWVTTGQQVASIGPPSGKRLIALISERDLDAFLAQTQKPLSVHLEGDAGGFRNGILQTPEPRGTTDILHPAFAATTGGPLDVRYVREGDAGREELSGTQLLRPHFRAMITLPESDMRQLHPGRFGYAGFVTNRGTLGSTMGRKLQRWFLQHAIQRRQL